MGVVWKAVDGKLDREVAIKLLPAELSQDAERLGSLRARSQAAGVAEPTQHRRRLRHRARRGHPLHRHGADRRRGPRTSVSSAARLSIDETIDVCRQIARALEVAHDGGVIHRDLKPANVKIDNEGRVKVLDFGLAKAFEPDPASGQANPSLSPTLTSAGTRAGMILGTAAYMSPEQARGRSVDKRSDVWSFGCVLFECLTGRQAFGGDTVTDTLASILKVEPDWSLLPANTPPRVRELLERCLAKELKSRLRDVGDGRQELERISSAHAVAVDSPVDRIGPGAGDDPAASRVGSVAAGRGDSRRGVGLGVLEAVARLGHDRARREARHTSDPELSGASEGQRCGAFARRPAGVDDRLAAQAGIARSGFRQALHPTARRGRAEAGLGLRPSFDGLLLAGRAMAGHAHQHPIPNRARAGCSRCRSTAARRRWPSWTGRTASGNPCFGCRTEIFWSGPKTERSCVSRPTVARRARRSKSRPRDSKGFSGWPTSSRACCLVGNTCWAPCRASTRVAGIGISRC